MLGALLVVLGMFALTSSVVLTIVSVHFLGFLLIVGGLLQLGGHFLDVVMGLINVTAGFMVLSNPGTAAVGLTLIIAYFLILGGVLRIAMAVLIRLHRGVWTVSQRSLYWHRYDFQRHVLDIAGTRSEASTSRVNRAPSITATRLMTKFTSCK
jgi:hypothetical protein